MDLTVTDIKKHKGVGSKRTVKLMKEADEGLGISITVSNSCHFPICEAMC